ncbi:MAG: DUF4384 domain-containing protein [Trueperaceae bacterium]|nr:DUF4384 domain-containing protein [Trueperaceae bacterium]
MRRTLLAGLALAFLAGGCTVTFVGGEGVGGEGASAGVNGILAVFEPTRGPDATYRRGDDVAFSLRSRRDGYVTLSRLNPDGEVAVVARNLRVRAHRTEVLDGSRDGTRFVVGGPRGWHRVRASFSPEPASTATARLEGRFGEGDWTAALRLDLAPFEVTDVAETAFYVR